MFKRLAYFTDIHFGRHNNDPVALRDNEAFVEWFIEEAKRRGCETFIFGGDWNDNRLNLNLLALDTGLKCMEKIAGAFDASYFIEGNHDLYFRDQRTISSVSFARHIDKITIINKPTVIGDVTFLPWLVGKEHHNLPAPTKYTFAHLEMSGFMMNAKSTMPESDHCMTAAVLDQHGTVFTGHFHMRQVLRNVIYTGNVMPFDFSDNWDDERGAMFLDWDGEPEFVKWPGQPLYRTMKLSTLMDPDAAKDALRPKMTAKVSVDVDLTYEEVQILKEHFVSTYELRKLELVPMAKQVEVQAEQEVAFQTIDQIVVESLLNVQSAGMKADTLVALYRSLA